MEFRDRDLSSAISLLTRGIEAEDTRAAVHWLGTRRGRDGVNLDHAFDDLTDAYRVAAGTNPAQHEYRDLALAWAEGAFAGVHVRGALDPETGLATRDYLATRLRDLARLGHADALRLVLVGPGQAEHRLAIMLRAARVATELVGSFNAAETPTQLSGDRVGALVVVDDGLSAGMRGLRHAIDRIDSVPASAGAAPAELRALELPSSADAVSAFLDAL